MSRSDTADPWLIAVCLRHADPQPGVDPLTGEVTADPRRAGLAACDSAALEHGLRLAEAAAGQAVMHSRVVQDRHTSLSTVMWARSDTRNSTVAICSSNDTDGHGRGAGSVTGTPARRAARRRPGAAI